MQLHVVRAVGRGGSERSAFDDALVVAGAGDHHVVHLGPTIPHGSTVDVSERLPVPAGRPSFGDRLYAVVAERTTAERGAQVWAGLSWAQDATSGHGLIVGRDAADEDALRVQLDIGLRDLQASRRIELGTPQVVTVGAMCTGTPTCAVVLCAFAVEAWPAEPVWTAASGPTATRGEVRR